jgi:acylphosphatase
MPMKCSNIWEVMTKHLNIKISGRVHGVGFRFGAGQLAEKLGLRGFVRNETDGLYIEVEGETDGLEKFVAWCGQGPTLAKVKKVELVEANSKDFSDFSIE